MSDEFTDPRIKNYVEKQAKHFGLTLDEVPEKMKEKLQQDGEKWLDGMKKRHINRRDG